MPTCVLFIIHSSRDARPCNTHRILGAIRLHKAV
jgi:hypothetical protein